MTINPLIPLFLIYVSIIGFPAAILGYYIGKADEYKKLGHLYQKYYTSSLMKRTY